MLYFHRRLIIAAIKGEQMPEPSEAAKKWCPPVRRAEKEAAVAAAAYKVEAPAAEPAKTEETAEPAPAAGPAKAEETAEPVPASEPEAPAPADVECRYVVRNTNTGIKFDLKTDGGEVLATSEVYSSKASCLNGIKSVRNNAPGAALEDQTVEEPEKCKNPKFEIYVDKAGEYRFRLKARNGQIVAVSRSHDTKEGCLGVIDLVRANADAEITEE